MCVSVKNMKNQKSFNIVHYIGFLCKMIKKNNKECNIVNEFGKRTNISVSFARQMPPNWLTVL